MICRVWIRLLDWTSHNLVGMLLFFLVKIFQKFRSVQSSEEFSISLPHQFDNFITLNTLIGKEMQLKDIIATVGSAV